MESPLDCTSANFEKVALSRLRILSRYLPQNSKIFREPWGSSTVVCIDFEKCPHSFPMTTQQTRFLSVAVYKLGLSNSIIFRLGNKILGWKKVNYQSIEE